MALLSLGWASQGGASCFAALRPRRGTSRFWPSVGATRRLTRGGGSLARLSKGWRVYMLRCRDGSLYTGATNDLRERLVRHAAGRGARYTRSRLPVTLVYEERARDQGTALRREAALKRLTRAEKLALIGVG